MTLTFPSRK
uniref:ATP synthase gamma subunit n=1 Tax=Capsicum annuum TaxID=4072 RepID=Q6RVW6_CAPAN|nr:ATP synthase gamma subunit [Capsicum annuum]